LAGAALGAVRRKPRAEAKADPAAGRPESPPPPARAGSADRPAGVPEAPVLRGAKAPKASPAAPSPGIAPPRGSAPAAPAAPAAASRPAPRGIRRIERKAEGTLPAPTGPAPSQAERLDEADSLTVFGARRMRAEGEPRSGGRVLGLTLTFVLLGLMGLVALWSLWFDGDGSPETVAEAPASALAPSVTPLDSGAPEGRQAAVPQPLPDAPAPDRAVSGSARPADDAVEPDPGTGEAIASAEPPESPAPEAAPGGEAAEAAPAASPEADPGPSALPAEPEIAALSPDAAPPTAPETSEPGATGPADGLVVVPNPLDPEAAEAAYAVTGIWQRAPDRGAIPRVVPRPDVTVASVDPSGLALAPPEPPAGAPRVAAPALPAAPLPPGTVLDDEGFVMPTAEGALAPGGYTVFEGQPDILPPRRPGSPTTEEDAAAPAEEAADRSDAPPDPLSDARPLPRPEDAPLVEAPAETPAPDAPEAGAALALEPDIRPRSRPGLQAEAETPDEAPAGAAGPGPAVETADAPAEETGAEEPAEQTAEQTGDAAPGPAPSVRPAPRPEALATEAERLLRQEESAEQVAREEAEAAARALAEAEIAAASRLAVEAAPGPRSRPANMAQIAANARARNAAAQERQATARAAATPQRAEAPAQTASAAAVAPAPQQARGPAVARNQRVAPDVPSNTLVARQATERNALRMNAVTLIGVYGSAGQRRALVRLPSGRYVKVQVGDRLDGGQVAAIDRDALRYVKSGRNHVIQMPSS